MPIQWIRTDLNNNVYKYHFINSNQTRLSWKDFLELLSDKDQDFFKWFKGALDDANSRSFPYRWNCSPISQGSLDKSFEFVVKKETGLQNNSQDYSRYNTYINGSSNQYAVNFLSNNGNPLIIPMPVNGKNFSSISYFTENASLEQQENFWQKASIEFTKEINRNPRETRWLCTEGLAVPYLHVRIDKLRDDNPPPSLFFAEYKNPNYTPIPTPRTPKEKILANLDKICLDPTGGFANSQAVEKYWSWGDYYDNGEAKKHGQHKITDQNGEEINLEEYLSFEEQERDTFHKEIRTAIINNIKKNPQDWEIYSDGSDSQRGNFIKNKKTGVKHYKSGFTIFTEKINGEWDEEVGQRDWAEIKNNIKNSPNEEQELKKWYNPLDYPLPWTITLVLSALLIVIIMTCWKRTKKRF